MFHCKMFVYFVHPIPLFLTSFRICCDYEISFQNHFELLLFFPKRYQNKALILSEHSQSSPNEQFSSSQTREKVYRTHTKKCIARARKAMWWQMTSLLRAIICNWLESEKPTRRSLPRAILQFPFHCMLRDFAFLFFLHCFLIHIVLCCVHLLHITTTFDLICR